MRIGLLYGGPGREANVSRDSADLVQKALDALGYETWRLEAGAGLDWTKGAVECDLILNMVHGAGGEDGGYAAVLGYLAVPYTSAGPAASAICFDKVHSKLFWREAGGDTIDHTVFNLENYHRIVAEFARDSQTKIVKPVAEGSSFGVTLCEDVTALRDAMEEVLAENDKGMVEPCLAGREFTLGFLDERYLGGVEIIPEGILYDFAAKYDDGKTKFVDLDEPLREAADDLLPTCRRYLRQVGVEGPSRFDFRMDQAGCSMFLEINTVPGMTGHSLLPMAALQSGLAYNDLVQEILCTARVK